MRDPARAPGQIGAARRGVRRRSAFHFSATEITVALAFAVVAVWSTLVVVVSLRQPVLGGDFMVFYTFGTAARLGEWALQYDWPAFHRLQVELIPASAEYFYPPAYPPLVPALYAPLSLLPFPAAYAIWIALSSAVYCGLLGVVARGSALAPRAQIILAGLLFPPFIAHQAIGHSTIWILIGFVGGWWALTRSRPVAAGLVFSLVAIKPHLGMALAVVLLATRHWQTVGGVVLGLAFHVAATIAVCGATAITAYVATTMRVLGDNTLINPSDDRHTHGLRIALESLMSHTPATVVWLLASAVFGWMLVRTWRATDDWTVRMSALLLATLLISPHVQTYDGILLAPAMLWLLGWAVSTRQQALFVAVPALAVAFVVPAAELWAVPMTLPLMAWLLWRCGSIASPSTGELEARTA